jgi:Zn-dependent peptidase ImmA (M78 family)
MFSIDGIKRYKNIANHYKVSYSSLLTRLVTLRLISPGQYQSEISQLKQREAELEEQTGGGGESLAKRARREKGDTFISLVLENSTQGHITHNDALDYLGVKAENLQEFVKT